MSYINAITGVLKRNTNSRESELCKKNENHCLNISKEITSDHPFFCTPLTVKRITGYLTKSGDEIPLQSMLVGSQGSFNLTSVA